MKHGYLYLLISISGASVLAIEFLGTRILGPFYGVSLLLWSALIAVTLAALAVGYLFGGRMADRGATYPRLGAFVAAAGVWLLFIPWTGTPLLGAMEHLGPRPALFLAAIVLFFVPLMLLGMVSPYAVKLKISSLDEVGRSVGNVYAVSSAATAAAAILTGFFLIPSFGVYRVMTAVGIILIATALPGLLRKRGTAMTAVLMAFVLIGGTALVARQHENVAVPERGVIFKGQSASAEIRVMDEGPTRFLLVDGGLRAAVDTSSSWATLIPYVNVDDIARSFFAEPGSLLLIGIGDGSIAKRFRGAGWKVDAVERDPLLVAVARTYFGFDSGDVRVVMMDGRRYLLDSHDRYDVIVLDAFGTGSIPTHLLTREAFDLAASRLKPDGILALNVSTVGWEDTIVRSLAATIKTQFPHVRALPTMEPPNAVGTVVLLASRRPLELPATLPVPIDRFSADYDRAHAWDNGFEPNTVGVPIVTDDRNPIDVWAEAIRAAERRDLGTVFTKPGVSR